MILHTLASCLVALAPAATPFEDLDAALKAARKYRPLRGRVTKTLAEEAVRRVSAGEEGRDLKQLVRIAHTGSAKKALAGALQARVVEDSEEALPFLRLLNGLPSQLLGSTNGFEAFLTVLSELVSDADGKALRRSAASLLGRLGAPLVVLQALRQLAQEADRSASLALLQGAARNRDPVNTFGLLLNAPRLGDTTERALRRALQRLVPHEAVGKQVLRALSRRGALPQRLWSCLSALRGKRRERARQRVAQRLASVVGAAQAPALEAALLLGVPKLLPHVLRLANTGEEAARVAALRALPTLMGAASETERATARTAVRQALDDGEAPLRAAGVTAAARLGWKDLLQDELLGYTDKKHALVLRLAALDAIPRVLSKTGSATLDALIALLGDRAVARRAWMSLRQLTKVNLPLRADLWRTWRTRQVTSKGGA